MMETWNIFYRLPSKVGARVVALPAPECSLRRIYNRIGEREALEEGNYTLATGCRVFRCDDSTLEHTYLKNNAQLDVLIPLAGGKGGFGSLLRAIGAQIEKTTNRDACRDLSGRRLRDVKREDELRKLRALQEKLLEERKRRHQEKIEKLRKRTKEAEEEGKSIQQLVAMFDDHDFNKRRLQLGEIIEAAVEKGVINLNKRKHEEEKLAEVGASEKKTRLATGVSTSEGDDKTSEPNSSGVDSDIKSSDNKPNQRPAAAESKQLQLVATKRDKKDLWLGLEDEFD